MKMIIGGAYQGKLAYAKSQNPEICWVDGEQCEQEEVFRAEGIYHFEKYIRRMTEEENWMEQEAIAFAKELTEKNPELLIVTQEVGYGLVPVDAFERKYRELTGRICTYLAGKAERVDRVMCGIGTVIKGGDDK